MASLDPYAALGVPRTASREDIARAYRSAVKRSHPDTGARTSPAQMARLTEAWRILGDPVRRAHWDREHALVMSPPAWSAPVVRPAPIRPRTPEAPPSRMDSGWVAAAVVAGIAVVVGGFMIAVAVIAGPPPPGPSFTSDEVSFVYPEEWNLAAGPGQAAGDRRVLAHLTSFTVPPGQDCLDAGVRCRWEGDRLPAGGASVQLFAWDTGPPPEPDPRDAPIGGAPSAHAQTTVGGEFLSAWWQLSPPGFPARWIEVRAEIRGGELERSRRMAEVDALLASLEFVEGP